MLLPIYYHITIQVYSATRRFTTLAAESNRIGPMKGAQNSDTMVCPEQVMYSRLSLALYIQDLVAHL